MILILPLSNIEMEFMEEMKNSRINNFQNDTLADVVVLELWIVLIIFN